MIEVEVCRDQGLIGTASIDRQRPPLRIRGRPGVVFIYCSELHRCFFVPLVCLFCVPGCLVDREPDPRLRPHLDAIPPPAEAEADAETPL